MYRIKCKAKYASGKKKGQNCKAYAKHPIGNPKFCGIHRKYYKKQTECQMCNYSYTNKEFNSCYCAYNICIYCWLRHFWSSKDFKCPNCCILLNDSKVFNVISLNEQFQVSYSSEDTEDTEKWEDQKFPGDLIEKIYKIKYKMIVEDIEKTINSFNKSILCIDTYKQTEILKNENIILENDINNYKFEIKLNKLWSKYNKSTNLYTTKDITTKEEILSINHKLLYTLHNKLELKFYKPYLKPSHLNILKKTKIDNCLICKNVLNNNECLSCKKNLCCKCDSMVDIKHICIVDNNNYKNCPYCNALINKIEGCSYMFCIICKTKFDWNTMKLINTPYFHNEHYTKYMLSSKRIILIDDISTRKYILKYPEFTENITFLNSFFGIINFIYENFSIKSYTMLFLHYRYNYKPIMEIIRSKVTPVLTFKSLFENNKKYFYKIIKMINILQHINDISRIEKIKKTISMIYICFDTYIEKYNKFMNVISYNEEYHTLIAIKNSLEK